MAKNKVGIPSVLSFEKKLVPSDGYMYGTLWENRHEDKESHPLRVVEKSVRGTVSNRLKAAIKNDPAKVNNEIEKPNLQTVDNCSLEKGQDTLKLNFTLKVLKGVVKPSACNDSGFGKEYEDVARKYIEKYKFEELAKRYVTNIANARFLWRNRVGAENIEVKIDILNKGEEKSYLFDAAKIGIENFDFSSDDLDDLAKKIAETLSEKRDFLLMNIAAFVQLGFAQEIYPSEELVLDKDTKRNMGKKSKVLYKIGEQAAMHSQKIGNALRTIDTWYPDFKDSRVGVGPIAVEPYGSVTNLGMAFRQPAKKADFYSLFDVYSRGQELKNESDKHYVMAVLVRGGVFGESGKEK